MRLNALNCKCFPQERRRSERAEIQRVRAEKEKDRQIRIAVANTHTSPDTSKLYISYQSKHQPTTVHTD